jgi:hypothetical protein
MKTMSNSVWLIIAFGLGLLLVVNSSLQVYGTTRAIDYNDGHEKGCSDSLKPEREDRLVQNAEDYSEIFMSGYSDGFVECSGLDTTTFDCTESGDGCDGLPYCNKLTTSLITCHKGNS